MRDFFESTGLYTLLNSDTEWWKTIVMYGIVGVLVYLAIWKKFEPLLLLPIAFGMFLANLPGADLIHLDMFYDEYYYECHFAIYVFWRLGSVCCKCGAFGNYGIACFFGKRYIWNRFNGSAYFVVCRRRYCNFLL